MGGGEDEVGTLTSCQEIFHVIYSLFDMIFFSESDIEIIDVFTTSPYKLLDTRALEANNQEPFM